MKDSTQIREKIKIILFTSLSVFTIVLSYRVYNLSKRVSPQNIEITTIKGRVNSNDEIVEVEVTYGPLVEFQGVMAGDSLHKDRLLVDLNQTYNLFKWETTTERIELSLSKNIGDNYKSIEFPEKWPWQDPFIVNINGD